MNAFPACTALMTSRRSVFIRDLKTFPKARASNASRMDSNQKLQPRGSGRLIEDEIVLLCESSDTLAVKTEVTEFTELAEDSLMNGECL